MLWNGQSDSFRVWVFPKSSRTRLLLLLSCTTTARSGNAFNLLWEIASIHRFCLPSQVGKAHDYPNRSVTNSPRCSTLGEDREFQKLSPEIQDLVMHLIAAHHGRARPHFPPDEAFDPDRPLSAAEVVAIETPRRFARLQRKYGRWGLAYLESLLPTADWAASTAPSAYVDETEAKL